MRGAMAGRPSSAGRRAARPRARRPARARRRRPGSGTTSAVAVAEHGGRRAIARRSVSARRARAALGDRRLGRGRAASNVITVAPPRPQRARCTGAPPSKRPRSMKMRHAVAPQLQALPAAPRANGSPRAGRPKQSISMPKKRAPGAEVDARLELDDGAVVEDRLLRQPLERAARLHRQRVRLARRRARRAIGLPGRRRGDQRVRAGPTRRSSRSSSPPTRPPGGCKR